MSGVYPNASMKELKFICRRIEKENSKYSDEFVPLKHRPEKNLLAVFRNRYFLAQIYRKNEWTRISINRTSLDLTINRWRDGISWDSLMMIKGKVGYGDRDAIEMYPKEYDVVNVANIRHLFILPVDHLIDCIWRKRDG